MIIQNNKFLKLGITYLGIFVVMIGIGLVVAKGLSGQGVVLDPSGKPIPTTPTPMPKTKYSVILLGGGGAGHDGGELADTMLVAQADTRKKQITLVNIPRDIWVPIKLSTTGQTEEHKINYAYYGGGAEEIKRWAKEITGISIDNYVWVDFGGFTKLVDLLGGLEVNVPQSFVDELYPITGNENESCGKTPEEIKQITATMSGLLVDQQFPCRYEKLEFLAGKTKMDGVLALKFVRSRHATIGGGDFARAARQQAVIEAIRNKLLLPANWLKMSSLISMAKKNVQTDAKLDELVQAAIKTPDPRGYTIKRITISTENVLTEGQSADGQYILMPKTGKNDWRSVVEFVQTQMDK